MLDNPLVAGPALLFLGLLITPRMPQVGVPFMAIGVGILAIPL